MIATPDFDDCDFDHSPLSGEFTRDGVMVEVEIYRRAGSDEPWRLEVVSISGGCTRWHQRFATDQEAFEAFVAMADADGIASFDQPVRQPRHLSEPKQPEHSASDERARATQPAHLSLKEGGTALLQDGRLQEGLGHLPELRRADREMRYIPRLQVMPLAVGLGDEDVAVEDRDDLVGLMGPAERARRGAPEIDLRDPVMGRGDFGDFGDGVARDDPRRRDRRRAVSRTVGPDRRASEGTSVLVQPDLRIGPPSGQSQCGSNEKLLHSRLRSAVRAAQSDKSRTIRLLPSS